MVVKNYLNQRICTIFMFIPFEAGAGIVLAVIEFCSRSCVQILLSIPLQ